MGHIDPLRITVDEERQAIALAHSWSGSRMSSFTPNAIAGWSRSGRGTPGTWLCAYSTRCAGR